MTHISNNDGYRRTLQAGAVLIHSRPMPDFLPNGMGSSTDIYVLAGLAGKKPYVLVRHAETTGPTQNYILSVDEAAHHGRTMDHIAAIRDAAAASTSPVPPSQP